MDRHTPSPLKRLLTDIQRSDKHALQIRPMAAVLALPGAFESPDGVEIAAQATVDYKKEARDLFMVRLVPGWRFRDHHADDDADIEVATDENGNIPPVLQLRELNSLLRTKCIAARAEDGPFIWPYHQREVCLALIAEELQGLLLQNFPFCQRSLFEQDPTCPADNRAHVTTVCSGLHLV